MPLKSPQQDSDSDVKLNLIKEVPMDKMTLLDFQIELNVGTGHST